VKREINIHLKGIPVPAMVAIERWLKEWTREF
jgi:hypothetical protein